MSKVLFGFWMIVTSPPLLLLIWIRESHPEFGAWIGVPLGLGWIFGSYWLGGTTAHHLYEENRMFVAAIKHTIYDLKLRLSFVPLLGMWFTPDEDKTKYDDDEV
jgi:hypothetical protein